MDSDTPTVKHGCGDAAPAEQPASIEPELVSEINADTTRPMTEAFGVLGDNIAATLDPDHPPFRIVAEVRFMNGKADYQATAQVAEPAPTQAPPRIIVPGMTPQQGMMP